MRIRSSIEMFAMYKMLATPMLSAADASSQGGAACRAAVGKERSTRLVSECLNVSPATHPPCNDQNSCVMIIEEIKRGCGMLGQDAPQFCLEYKN